MGMQLWCRTMQSEAIVFLHCHWLWGHSQTSPDSTAVLFSTTNILLQSDTWQQSVTGMNLESVSLQVFITCGASPASQPESCGAWFPGCSRGLLLELRFASAGTRESLTPSECLSPSFPSLSSSSNTSCIRDMGSRWALGFPAGDGNIGSWKSKGQQQVDWMRDLIFAEMSMCYVQLSVLTRTSGESGVADRGTPSGA